MSKIDELIKELCPKGVQFKQLSELGTLYGGLTGKSKNDFKDGNARFITYMNVFSNIEVDTSRDDFVKIGKNERQRTLHKGDVLFTGSSENPDECGMSSVLVKEPEEPLYLNSFCFILRMNDKDLFLPEFLKYLFRDTGVRKQITKTASGVTRFNVSKKRFAKVVVPIPPIEVQKEIANILDTFTQLEAELEAELEARRKQYEYYRNGLLNFGDDVEWITLGKITRIFTSSRVHKNEWTTSGVPFYRSSDVISKFNNVENSRGKAYISNELYETLSAKSGKIKKDDILITGGGTIGIPYIVPSDEPLHVKDADLLCIQKSERLNSKFLYHFFLTTNFRQYLKNITHDATIAHYTISQIANTPVPLPTLEEQSRIVALLDCFEGLTNDIMNGLPAEIAARRKQYEYYRTKLLTFQELPV